jgi:hypothetical protein
MIGNMELADDVVEKNIWCDCGREFVSSITFMRHKRAEEEASNIDYSYSAVVFSFKKLRVR